MKSCRWFFWHVEILDLDSNLWILMFVYNIWALKSLILSHPDFPTTTFHHLGYGKWMKSPFAHLITSIPPIRPNYFMSTMFLWDQQSKEVATLHCPWLYSKQLGTFISTLRHYCYHLFRSTDSIWKPTPQLRCRDKFIFISIKFENIQWSQKSKFGGLAISWFFLLNLEVNMDKVHGLQKQNK